MAELGTVTFNLAVAAADAVASLRSVFDVLATSDTACESLLEVFPGVLDRDGLGAFVLREDAVDVFLRKAVTFAALGAAKSVGLQLNPSDRYLEAVAALVASVPDLDSVIRHGWPILSLVGDTPSMTEAAGASSSSRGGSPA